MQEERKESGEKKMKQLRVEELQSHEEKKKENIKSDEEERIYTK